MLAIIILLLLLGVRTTLWHLKSWQLREYRSDRMKAWLRTKDGRVFWYPWIKPGLLPRPKITGRIILIVGILGLINLLLLLTTHYLLPTTYYLLSLLLWERTLFIQVAIAVMISGIPTRWKAKKRFAQAKVIVAKNPDIIRVGITGSYGKSTTKELLVHLLKDHFGTENVLYNPANQNNELAIARLIINNQNFFEPSKKKKILVIETGAYKKGEIATVCNIINPQIGILTGLNEQHIELFGSQMAIADAKFELPAACTQKVFFNADSDRLVQLFEDRSITATKIGLSLSSLKNLKSKIDHSTFEAYGESFRLPWPGKFFVENALLAIECSRELGVPADTLAKSLGTIAPLERALSLHTHENGFTVLSDTYSANTDGVLRAIEHLGNFDGTKVFVGLPLRELGDQAAAAHQEIFEALKQINAEVFWCRPDFVSLGTSILKENFHELKQDFSLLKKTIKSLGKNDAILLESKVPAEIEKICQ